MRGVDLRIDTAAFKILIIGETGSGKTTSLATFPRVHIMDFDGGLGASFFGRRRRTSASGRTSRMR